ncbi:MAG: hypothetical protein KAR57_07280 [Bacteroidales bacterium]|nr:hypothetical protein [Bacteroidales bacterium]
MHQGKNEYNKVRSEKHVLTYVERKQRIFLVRWRANIQWIFEPGCATEINNWKSVCQAFEIVPKKFFCNFLIKRFCKTILGSAEAAI